jgi:cobalt-zinc-cadmium efflux system outer membrane protein
MKVIALFVLGTVCLLPATAARGQGPDPGAALGSWNALIALQNHAGISGPLMNLDDAERIALAENPEIHVAARHVAAVEAHVPIEGALDDPQLMYRGWGVPLSKPWDYNSAQNMLMIGQALPGPGKRTARTAIAQSDVSAAKAELSAARLRVQVEVRRAFFDLLRAQDEIRIHDQHVEIANQAIQAARIKYTVGKIPQVEILKAQLALTRLAEHMIRFERDADVAQARLNALLGRDPAAPVEVQGDYGLDRPLPSIEYLTQAAMQSRPDLLEASTAAEKSRRQQQLAKKSMLPDFSVAAGYMLMPSGSNTRNDYMLEGSVTLPWLNRHKHDAEMAEAANTVTEKDAELDAMRNAARGQIQEALADAKAAQRLARVYQEGLRKQAEDTLHSAVIAYENDQTSFLDLLDSQMTVVDIDLAWIDALGEFNARLADLEMAAGAPFESTMPANKMPATQGGN